MHGKTTIKIKYQYLLALCVTCKKSICNLKLIDNLIVLPDTSTVYGELCWLTELGSFWIEAAIHCLRGICAGMISFGRRHRNFNSYKQI
jgi:hypothetical protein